MLARLDDAARARALGLPAGVGGAWIGTSEFADAAGFAAAQAYGGLAGPTTGIAGTADQAVWSYTLIKVIGRAVDARTDRVDELVRFIDECRTVA